MRYISHVVFISLYLSLFVGPLITAQSQSTDIITGLIVVNSESETDLQPLRDNGVIDLDLYRDIPLTVRVKINEERLSDIDEIEFNLDDGTIIRTEQVAPFFLGGDTDGNSDAVNTLKEAGSHQLTVSAFKNSQIIDTLLIDFTVVDSTVEASPTTAPSSIHDVPAYRSSAINGTINGVRRRWHKITIGFDGAPTGERNNIVNPFTDFRLDVTFTHKTSGNTYIVPGFYACDGNAANTGASSGSVWLVHFRPDRPGNWNYSASFTEGPNVAVNKSAGVSASFFDGASGSFNIAETNMKGRDFRGKGRLKYVGERYLRFNQTGRYFLKAGADSPENFLAYADFDNTPNNGGWRKNWAPHVMDYVAGDPTWMGGKGRGIIGAINYLSSMGMNVFSFLTMNIDGDDQNVFPFLSNQPIDFNRMDCSKTAQWDVVFDHAERKGMFLHFKTQETENDQLLSGGGLGVDRKVYYRELIARFGHHLALNWNLGEENTNTVAQRKAFANYIKEIDPYDHPIVMHTYPGSQDENYGPLLGHSSFDGASLQIDPNSGYEETLKWVERSDEAGRKWIVSFDEQGPSDDGVVPDGIDPNHDVIRKNVLWGNLMAGGAGVEYYFGYDHDNSDLSLQDFRSRSRMWEQSKHALDFFWNLTFWNMTDSGDRLTTGTAWSRIQEYGNTTMILYLPNGGSAGIDLSGLPGIFQIQWYDPRSGGELKFGSVPTVAGTYNVSIGFPPYDRNEDWAVLLKCITKCKV